MPVVGRPLLLTVGLADGAIHIQNEFVEWLPPVDFVDPLTREMHQRRKVTTFTENLGLEPAHLAAGGRLLLRLARSSANHVTQHGVHTQPLSVVHIFIAGQSAVD